MDKIEYNYENLINKKGEIIGQQLSFKFEEENNERESTN
jgi:hypothetical protein